MTKLICTTDIHGQVFAQSYKDKLPISYGMSRIASAIKQYDQPILIDNGDVLQGTPLNTFVNKEKNPLMAKAFNALHYHYFNIGNHDFNYGPDLLMNHIENMTAKCITTNVLYQNKSIGSPQIITIDSIVYGIIGVVTDYIDHWEKPENLVGLTILPVVDTVKKMIETVKSQVDKIIVVYHGGFERDLITGNPTEALTGENVGYELSLLPEVDLLLTGHQHRSFVEMVNNTLCLQCTHFGKEFMEVDLSSMSGRLVNTSEFDVDTNFESLFELEQIKTQEFLDKTLGVSDIDLHFTDLFKAQKEKPPVVSFINQLLIRYYNADLAFCSLFNDSQGLKNPITLRELSAYSPFPNTFDVLEMDKKTLLEYLEQLASYWTIKEGEITVDDKFRYPKPQFYNYDMGDGLSYTINVSAPVGNRISDLVLPDKELYRVVINNYRSAGGGDFLMMPKCKKLYSDTKESIEILSEYIEQHSPLTICHISNIKVIK